MAEKNPKETSIAESDDPIQAVITDDAVKAKHGRYGWLSIVVATLFGLFYAYDLWEAVSNIVELPSAYESAGLHTDAIPWWVLIIGLVIPPVVFGIAVGIGRRQNVGAKAVIFLVGLAVVAGLSLGDIALEQVLRPSVPVVVESN